MGKRREGVEACTGLAWGQGCVRLQRGLGVPGALGQGDWGTESFGEEEL